MSTRSTLKLVGKYSVTPVTLANGQVAYLLLDKQGRVVNLLSARNDSGDVELLILDANRSLHATHSHNLQMISITTPGAAYVNGTNALCIAKPSDENNELEICVVRISTKTAGDFYLVADNLGVDPGSTTDNTFDLVGLFGDGVTNDSDVVWAAFMAANRRGVTAGEYHFDLGAGKELYLIAPDVAYNIVVVWLEETP